MNKAQRIHFIQTTSNILVNMDSIGASLVLHQFGWYSDHFLDQEFDSNQKFIISFVSRLDDDELQELYDYLTNSFKIPEEPGDRTSEQTKVKLFITHLESNRSVASQLKDHLAIEGVLGFVAHEDIPDTEEWRQSLKSELSSADALLVVLTDGIDKSFWCQQEIGWALGRGIPLIGVNYVASAPPVGFLSDFQFIPGNIAMSAVVARIVAALKKSPKLESLLRAELIKSFCESESFKRTRDLLPRILELESITDSERKLLLDAVESNSQISDAWTSSSTVANVLKKFLASDSES